MFSRYKIVLLLLLASLGSHAQQELMLSSSRDIWHSNGTNPAFFPEGKRFVIGLPGYSLDAAHSGNITYNDVLRKEGNRTIIDLGKAIEKLEPQNDVYFDQRIETVSLGIRSRNDKWGLQFGHAILLSGWIKYPKSLAEVLWNGNAPYVGQTLDIGLQTSIFDWQEWSASVSRRMGKLSLGARIKYLTGVSALNTVPERNTMRIYTDPDIYQLSLATDYAFYSSSIISSIDTAGLGFDFVTGSFGKKPSVNNSGVAFDLGFEAKLSENLSVNASVLNLGGKINWKRDANYFYSKNEYTYEGGTFPGTDIINGADSINFDSKLDTLNDIFQFQKQAATFETTIPLRVLAGGTFKFSERWQMGVHAYYQKTDNRTNTAMGVSLRWLPLRWLSLGAMYSANSRSSANIGFHVAVTPGPIQMYFASDNLLNAFSLKSSPAINLRAGAALAF